METLVQRDLEKLFGGGHVRCWGNQIADIVTNEFLIEIKHWSRWRDAVGQVTSYSANYPHLLKCVALFGQNGKPHTFPWVEVPQNLNEIGIAVYDYDSKIMYLPSQVSPKILEKLFLLGVSFQIKGQEEQKVPTEIDRTIDILPQDQIKVSEVVHPDEKQSTTQELGQNQLNQTPAKVIIPDEVTKEELKIFLTTQCVEKEGELLPIWIFHKAFNNFRRNNGRCEVTPENIAWFLKAYFSVWVRSHLVRQGYNHFFRSIYLLKPPEEERIRRNIIKSMKKSI